MGAPEAIGQQDLVGLGREVAIGIEQKLDPLAQLVLAPYYVSYVDLISGNCFAPSRRLAANIAPPPEA
jgi:hypothetical protein